MGACLPIEEGACWWDDRQHPVNLDGERGRQELARACAEVWLAALRWYYTDAQAAMRGIKTADLEALEDLTGSRRLLATLLEPLDACPQRVGDAFIEALDAGLRFNSGAMNRVVPEIYDNWTEVHQWRERTKRKGKPEALTLG